MAGNLINITDAGRAALVAAGNTGTVARRVVEIGLGTAAFTFDKGMKTLPNERKRVTTFGGESVSPDTVHVVIQDDSNDRYSLYAYGLYLDNGVLFGVYVQNTPILEKSPTAMLLLASDIVFASIDAAQLQFGPATFLNPPATTERKGVAELATQAEVDAGIDDTRIVTPKGAAMRYMPFTGGRFTGPIKIAKGTGAIPDDGSSVLQAIGNSRTTGTTYFGPDAKSGRAHTDDGRFYLTSDGDMAVGPGAAGKLLLTSGNVQRVAVTPQGRTLVGKRLYDDGETAMQVMPEGTEGYAFAVHRANADGHPQAIMIGASPSATTRNENVIESRSALDNAKPLVLSATSDVNNAEPSRGVVAIWMQVLGQTKAVLTKDGQFLLGVGTYATGPAQLQVSGAARFGGQIWRGLTNTMLVGSSDSAGIQNAGTGGDAAVNNARFSADQVGAMLNLGKSRGTKVGEQAAVAAGDELGRVDFAGSDGERIVPGARIQAIAESGFAKTSRAAALDFSTVANGSTSAVVRVRISASGRTLFGTTQDNGRDIIQAKGSISASNGVISMGIDTDGGGQLRAVSQDYGAFIRNDNRDAWLMSTDAGDPFGKYNNFRPFQWSLINGNVTIDGTGLGTRLGGDVGISKNLSVTGIGYFSGGSSTAKSYGSGVILGANTGGDIVLKCANADVDMKMWDMQSNESQLNMRAVDDQWTRGIPFLTATRENKSNAIRSLALVPAGGRVQIAGAPDDDSSALAVRGSIKGINSTGALVASNGGGSGQTSIHLRRDGAPADQKTWELMTGGDGSLTLRTVNDAYSNSQTAISVSRASSYSLGAMQLMPQGGRVMVGPAKDDSSVLLNVGGLVAASAPPAGDNSNKLVTSAWVTAAILNSQVGQIVWEARTGVRAGYLKLNGAELKRADYPALWAYAQASGALVSQADWLNGRWGCFSTGDGTTTFRLPEMRGEFIRCWADGRNDIDPQRAIGSYQGDQNRSHVHGASASEVGDHVHSAWTDAQGQHNHPLHDPGHAHGVRMGRVGVVATSYGQGWGPYNWDRQDMHGTEGAGTGIWLDDAGIHGHNVGIGGAGRHSHGITVNADGGNEARPRNVALLAMIRAY